MCGYTCAQHSSSRLGIHNVIIFMFQGGTSVLGRLVDVVRTWADRGSVAVQVLSVQPVNNKIPATRVWLTAAGIANFDHLLLYHKKEVNTNNLTVTIQCPSKL